MKTAYDIQQKIYLMAIALGISLLLLGLNACQKTESDAGKTAESAGKTMGKVVDTSREAAGETMKKTKDAESFIVGSVDTASEKTKTVYQASSDTLYKAVGDGVVAYASAVKKVETAVGDSKDAANTTGQTAGNLLNQATTSKTNQ